MRRALAATIALPLLFLAGCPADDRTDATRTDTVTRADAEESLEQLARQYEQAVAAGDKQALERLHTGDAWLSFGTGQSGSPAQVLSDTAANLTLEMRRTEIVGDWAYTTGTWRQQLAGPEGTQQQLDGHYLTVFRRENGEWRVREVVSNMSEEAQRTAAQLQQTPPRR